MDTIYETKKYRGYTINIYYDPSPESPRNWDNLGTMYTAHRRYCPEKDFDQHFNINEVVGQHFEFLPSFEKKYIAVPVYMYDHSGQTVSTTPYNCRWDSGWFGMVAVDIEKVKKEYNWRKITRKRREKILNYLQGEVECYDKYLTGEVYGYQLYSPTGEEIESCWGFFGDDGIKHLISECKASVDIIFREEFKEKFKAGIQLLLPFSDLEVSPA